MPTNEKSMTMMWMMMWTPRFLIPYSIFQILALACLILAPASSAARSTLLKPANNLGLVGYWSFDEGTSTKATDFSGNGYTGTFTAGTGAGKASWANGKRGKAINFGGINVGGIDIGTSTNTALNPSRFTVVGWIYVNTPQTYGTNTIFSNTRDCCGTYNGINFQVASSENGKLYASNWNSSAFTLISNSSIATSTWTHVAYAYDGTNQYIYINGVLDKSQANTTDPGAPASYRACLGSLGYDAGTPGNDCQVYTLNGKLDDMRLYNRALSASAIAKLYAGGTAGAARANASSVTLQNGTTLGPANGLVGHWTFDGADTQSTITDRSGQNNHGYFNGGATSSAKTIGKLGQALNFNGVGNYVRGPTISNANVTLSAWVKPTVSPVSNTEIISDTTDTRVLRLNSGSTQGVWAWFQASDSNFHEASTTTALPVGAWSHVVSTFDGSTIKLYINGTQVDSTTTPITLKGAGNFLVGIHSGLVANPFTGPIDDVRIYNRALTPAEVKQLYLLGQTTVKP